MKYFLTILFIFLSLSLSSQDFSSICLDNKEQEIINLINQYRTENNLPELKLSASLCYVADVHAKDLCINRPQDNCGSLNSWSNKGRWSRICYNKSKTALKDMKNKPSELTQYRGQSMELVYYSSVYYTAQEVLNEWKQHPPFNNLMLNKQPYASTKWIAIGAGYFEGYLCVWFGPLEDKFTDVERCEDIPVVQEVMSQEIKAVATTPGGVFVRDRDDVNVANKSENNNLRNTHEVEIIHSNTTVGLDEIDEIKARENTFEDDFEDFDKIPDEKTIIEEKFVEETIVVPQTPVIHENTIISTEMWYVIVTVASDKQSADDAVTNMKNIGYSNSSAVFDKDAKYQFRIAAGSFTNRDDAEILKNELVKKGYKDAWLLKK